MFFINNFISILMFSISIAEEMRAHSGWVLLGKEFFIASLKKHIAETNENGHLLCVFVFRALTSGSGVALALLLGASGPLIGVAISASLLPPVVNCVSKFQIENIDLRHHLDTGNKHQNCGSHCVPWSTSVSDAFQCFLRFRIIMSYLVSSANESFPASSLSRSEPSLLSLRPA